MPFRRRRHPWLRTTALITLAALAGAGATHAAETAVADAPAASDPGAGGAVQEVVVTARRREESLAKVPVAEIALGSKDLAQRSIETDADLQRNVPGLVVRQNFNANFINYSIRGQTIDAFSASRPAVVAYFDDVQTPQGASVAFYDLASIQVLKGPQGTLFGRNTTGGAVLSSTTMPKDAFGGYLTVGVGDYSDQEVQGALDVPVIADKLLVRIAGFEKTRDGYVDNVFSGEELGALRQQSGRITILARPTDKLTVTTVYQYGSNHGTDAGGELYSAYPCSGGKNGSYSLVGTADCLYSPLLDTTTGVPGAWNAFLAAHPGAPAGGILAFLGQQQAWGPWKTSLDEPEGFKSYETQVANTIKYEFSPTLTFKNIFGFGSQRTRQHSDLDGTPYPIEHNINTADNEDGVIFNTSDLSEEAQLLGTALGGDLRYITGLYYSDESDDNRQNLQVVNLIPIIYPSPDTYAYRLHNESQALFVQGTYDLGHLTGIHNLRFTAGARYTWDENQIDQLPGSVLYAAVGTGQERESDSKPSWQFGLEYQVTPELLLYVNQRGSWRGGGFNGAAPPIDTPAANGGNLFVPETTEDVEVGAKFSGEIAGHPVRFSADFYDQWIDNVQRTAIIEAATGLISVTASAPAAEVTGVEADGDIGLTNWLRVGGSFAWTDARYTNGNVLVLGQTLAFNSYPDAPDYSGDAYVAVSLPVPPALGQIIVRGDVYAQSVSYLTNENFSTEPGTGLPAYHLINLHLDWNGVMNSRYSISAFATNVGNERYYSGGIGEGDSLGLNIAVPGIPRMYGVSVTARF